MRKWYLILAVLALLLSGGFWAYAAMMGPMYTPGSVAALPASALRPPSQQREGVWQVEADIALRYVAQGEGRPVLVIHGGPAIPNLRPWQALGELEKQYRFYYYQQRGCGQSTRPFDRFEGGSFYANMQQLEARLGLGAQIADIERIRQILGEERLLLIGHSFGGLLATLYAAEFPDRVARLALVAPAGLLSKPDEGRDLFSQAARRLEPEERRRYEALRARYFDFAGHFERSERELALLHMQLGGYLLRGMGYPLLLPPEPAPGKLPIAGGWSVFACYFSMGQDWDFSAALDAVQAKTTILIGADDELSKAGAESYTRIPGSKLLVLRRTEADRPVRHMPFAESPRQFCAGIRQALDAGSR